MSIADKLNKLLNTKYAIKHAIMNKGVDIDDDTKFSDYPSKIDAIITGSGGSNSGGSHYEKLWGIITNDDTDYSYLLHKSSSSKIDLSELDTSHVFNMAYMFYDCKSLMTLDLSNLDTSNVTTMESMFYSCNSIVSINLSNLDTSNVTTMAHMFDYCKSLMTLDLSNLDTSNVTTMENMFNECRALKSINLSNFNTSNVTTMASMFAYTNLKSIDVSSFDTSEVKDISNVFYACKSLTSLDLSNWDIKNVTGNYNLNSAFNYCDLLVDFYPPKNISANMDVSYSKALSHDSLMRIINNLITTTSTKKLTLGTTNKAKLTAEEIAIATNKGWTIA